MTKKDAANELISMYALYREQYGDSNRSGSEAVTLAVAALAESAGHDSCNECHEEHNQLGMVLSELKAIRSVLETK